ncbi:MAG: M23 family metallopeptidase [Nanoarchaeota archaeon]|nr:M23 family metallopeptidase [Nanoarchaeota archaeon]
MAQERSMTKMKALKKIGLIGILAAALIAGPMPGIKATSTKPNYTKLEQVLSTPSAYAQNNAGNASQIQNSQYPKQEDLVGKLQWPLDNPLITQVFGASKGKYYGPQGHLGLDMTESFGASVKAAANGIVVAKGTDECPNFEKSDCNYGMGNWIMLYHPDLKIHTVYSHLKEKSYKSIDEKVWQGETIGHQGGSGFQFYITSGPEKPITGDDRAHHLDLMVGVFTQYTTREGKTDIQFKKVYDPQIILPSLSK